LLYQRGDTACEFLLLGNTDLKNLLGFRPSWGTTQGRYADGDSARILDLANAELLG